jgi:fermentation-respiration switch protein FrsA (DUF1100 family)
MKRMMGAVLVVSAVVITPAFAHHGWKTKHHGGTHGHRHYRAVSAPPSAPYSVPPALDRRDPSRPGGLDPSFTPRGR